MRQYDHLIEGVGEEVPSPALGKLIIKACESVYGDLGRVPFPILVAIDRCTSNGTSHDRVSIDKYIGVSMPDESDEKKLILIKSF